MTGWTQQVVDLGLIVEADTQPAEQDAERFRSRVLADLQSIYGPATQPIVTNVTGSDVVCAMSVTLTRQQADDLQAAQLLGKHLRAAAARLGPCVVAVVLDGMCHVLAPDRNGQVLGRSSNESGEQDV
jgi:hypothetical protein